MNRYGITGWRYTISEKLKKSIQKRVVERPSGIVAVPLDIINRVHKENLNNPEIDSFGKFEKTYIKSFCIDCYSEEYVLGR